MRRGRPVLVGVSRLSLSLHPISLLGDVLYNSAWTLPPSVPLSPFGPASPFGRRELAFPPLFIHDILSIPLRASRFAPSKSGDGGEAKCKTEMQA